MIRWSIWYGDVLRLRQGVEEARQRGETGKDQQQPTRAHGTGRYHGPERCRVRLIWSDFQAEVWRVRLIGGHQQKK